MILKRLRVTDTIVGRSRKTTGKLNESDLPGRGRRLRSGAAAAVRPTFPPPPRSLTVFVSVFVVAVVARRVHVVGSDSARVSFGADERVRWLFRARSSTRTTRRFTKKLFSHTTTTRLRAGRRNSRVCGVAGRHARARPYVNRIEREGLSR